GDNYVPLEYHNIVDLDRAVLPWIVKGCMAAFALLVVWRCRTPLGDRTDWKLQAEYAIVLLGMLLFSERTWKHHAVTLAVPFAVLCCVLWVFDLSPLRRGIVFSSLAISSLLMLSTSTGSLVTHDLIGKTAQVYGAYVVAFATLAAALFGLLGWPLVSR